MISQRHRGAEPKKFGFKFKNQAPRYTPPDPNAMNVDWLSLKDWDDHIRKGQCFVCHEQEHVARDCGKRPTASTPRPTSGNPRPQKYTNTADVYARLRVIYRDLPESEQDGLYKKLEDGGF